MQRDAGVLGQPPLHVGVLVGGVAVAHDVEFAPGVGLGDELEERQELGVGVPLVAGVGDPAGGDFQGGEQGGGAVALVVVGLLLRHPRAQGQDRGGPVQGLDLGLRAPRGAALPNGGERTPSPGRRSGPVKLRAA